MEQNKIKSDKDLGPELYRVARQKETEAPFSGKYWDSHKPGMYKCAVCGAMLFSADAKFDSGTGWPSFSEAASAKNIKLETDLSGRMDRVEVSCRNCGAHLGHLFDDGPKEKGGKRYCINSICLKLEEPSKK